MLENSVSLTHRKVVTEARSYSYKKKSTKLRYAKLKQLLTSVDLLFLLLRFGTAPSTPPFREGPRKFFFFFLTSQGLPTNEETSQDVNNPVSMFLSPQMPRPHRGSLYHRSPRRRRRREVTTVAQQLGSKAAWCDAAAPSPALWIRRGQRPEGDAGASLRDRTPRTTRLSRFIQCSPAAASRAHHIGFRLSPALAFSVPSQPLRSDVLAQRFSDSSVHTRTERACSSHFPEFNSQPLREGAGARIQQPTAVARGRRPPHGLRARSHKCARTRSPPRLGTNRFLLTPHESTM